MITLKKNISSDEVFAILVNKHTNQIRLFTEKGVREYFDYKLDSISDTKYASGESDVYIGYFDIDYLHNIVSINRLDNHMIVITLGNKDFHETELCIDEDEAKNYAGLNEYGYLPVDIVLNEVDWNAFKDCLQKAIPEESADLLLLWELQKGGKQ